MISQSNPELQCVIFVEDSTKNLIHIYVCRFGTKSLKIHMKSCRQKFDNQQSQKEKYLLIKLPKEEPQLLQNILNDQNIESLNIQEIEKFNRQAFEMHKYKILPQCKNCGRTFNEESLLVHMKSCKPKQSSSAAKGSSSPSKNYGSGSQIYEQSAIKKPRVLMCCVCGRQFGLTSLKIHYYQCVEKYKNEQKLKPKEERQPLPKFTEEQESKMNMEAQWSLEDIEAFNVQAMEQYRNKALVQCSNCQRKFFAEAYKKHQKNCQLINGARNSPSKGEDRMYQSNNNKVEEIRKPKVLMCHICGRQFGLSSLTIHQRTCKQKFVTAESKKERKQRKKLPELNLPEEQNFDLENALQWSVEKIERYNSMANEVYKGCSLFPCRICGRKFFESALQKHLNYCEKNKEREDSRKEVNRNISHVEKRPSPEKGKAFLRSQNPKFKQRQSQNKSPPVSQKPSSDNCLKQIDEKELLQKAFSKDSTQSKELRQLAKSVELPEQNSSPKKDPYGEKQISTDNSDSLSSVSIGKVSDLLKSNNLPMMDTVKQESEEMENTIKSKAEGVVPAVNEQNKVNKVEEFQTFGVNKGSNEIQDLKLNEEKIESNEFLASPSEGNSDFQKLREDVEKAENHPREALKKQQNDDYSPAMNLVKCSKCSRSFNQERIQKHERVCKGQTKKNAEENTQLTAFKQQKNELSADKNKSDSNLASKWKRPPAKQSSQVKEQLISEKGQRNQSLLASCKKCGRKFIPDRLQKHESVCKEVKKVSQRRSLSKDNNFNEQTRQKNSIKKNVASLQAVDKKLQFPVNTANDNSQLKPCSICNRKFNSDRIQKHESVCKGKPIQKVQTKLNQKNQECHKESTPLMDAKKYSKENGSKNFSLQGQANPIDDRQACKNCGRKFNKDRIEKHQSICKNTISKKQQTEIPMKVSKDNISKGNSAFNIKKQPRKQQNTNYEKQKSFEQFDQIKPINHTEKDHLVSKKMNYFTNDENIQVKKDSQKNIAENINETKRIIDELQNDSIFRKIDKRNSGNVNQSQQLRRNLVKKTKQQDIQSNLGKNSTYSNGFYRPEAKGKDLLKQRTPENFNLQKRKFDHNNQQSQIKQNGSLIENFEPRFVAENQNFYEQFERPMEEGFIGMVKQIKQMRKADQQIDKELDSELENVVMGSVKKISPKELYPKQRSPQPTYSRKYKELKQKGSKTSNNFYRPSPTHKMISETSNKNAQDMMQMRNVSNASRQKQRLHQMDRNIFSEVSVKNEDRSNLKRGKLAPLPFQ